MAVMILPQFCTHLYMAAFRTQRIEVICWTTWCTGSHSPASPNPREHPLPAPQLSLWQFGVGTETSDQLFALRRERTEQTPGISNPQAAMAGSTRKDKQDRLRRKGQTILGDDGLKSPPAIYKSLPSQGRAASSLPTAPFDDSNHLAFFPLTSKVRSRAIRLWPSLVLCGDHSVKPYRSAEAWADGFTDANPEMEVFWWECLVLAIVHTIQLLPLVDAEVGDTQLDKSLFQSIPTPDVSFLDKGAVQLLSRTSKSLCHAVYQLVFAKMNGVPIEAAGNDASTTQVALVAIEKVEHARKEEYQVLRELKEVRLGKMFGASCAHCRVMSTKHKTCSACRRVYYCGSACQKSHWKTHKSECASTK